MAHQSRSPKEKTPIPFAQMVATISEQEYVNLHIHTMLHLDIIKVLYLPIGAQLNCLKTFLKFTLKLTLKQLERVSV
jgi:hypothetical protein